MLIVRTWHKLQLKYSTLPFWCGLLTPKSPFQQWIVHTMPYFCLTLSPLLVNQKEERLIFLNEEIQTRKNISQGQIYWEICIEAPWITYILPDHFHQHRFGQYISMQWHWVSNVCTGASVKGRTAEMSGFLVWWLHWKLYRAHAVQTLIVLAVLSHATLCDIPFLYLLSGAI